MEDLQEFQQSACKRVTIVVMHLSMSCPNGGIAGIPRGYWHFQQCFVNNPHPKAYMSCQYLSKPPWLHRNNVPELNWTQNTFTPANMRSLLEKKINKKFELGKKYTPSVFTYRIKVSIQIVYVLKGFLVFFLRRHRPAFSAILLQLYQKSPPREGSRIKTNQTSPPRAIIFCQ